MFKWFVIKLLKWIKYKNELTIAYCIIWFWVFKSLESAPNTWQVLKREKNFFLKDVQISKYRFWMIWNPNFSLFFPRISGTVCCWKYRFPTKFLIKFQNTKNLKIFSSCPPANTTHLVFGMTCFDKCFLFYVITGRHYFS